MSDTLTSTLPLAGLCVAVTRPREQAADIIGRLEALGAETIGCPTIAIEPPHSWDALDRAVLDAARPDGYQWIAFTSANAVDAFANRLAHRIADATIVARIAVVGPATARAVAARLREPDVISRVHLAERLANELGDVRGQRILFPCADIARETLPELLRARGAIVDRVTAYRTVPGDGVAGLTTLVRDGSIDVVLFTSPSCARSFVDGIKRVGGGPFQQSRGRPALICLGPVTAEAARDSGLTVDAVAGEHTTEGLIGAVMHWFASTNGRR